MNNWKWTDVEMNVSSLDLSFKLETFIVVILHYSYFYLHFCKCQYLKSKHVSKECIFKFAEIKKKYKNAWIMKENV